MRRILILLLTAALLCSCGRNAAAPSESVSALPSESESAFAEEEPSSEAKAALPELSGVFVAQLGERVDSFADGRQQLLGTDADKSHFDGILDTLREKTSVIRFSYNQGDTTENFDLTAEQCEDLVTAAVGFGYSVFESAPGNPPTGGAWETAFYTADGTELLYMSCNGDWLVLSDSDERCCIFSADSCPVDPYDVVQTSPVQ